MKFTAEQYDEAIANLQAARLQLEPDGVCACCGDSGHQAFECGHNPLVAMWVCRQIAVHSETLHQILHFLAGYEQVMGVQLGPAKVVMPNAEALGEGVKNGSAADED